MIGKEKVHFGSEELERGVDSPEVVRDILAPYVKEDCVRSFFFIGALMNYYYRFAVLNGHRLFYRRSSSNPWNQLDWAGVGVDPSGAL